MASNEGKTLWVAVAALVTFGAMMVWVLAGPGEQAEDEAEAGTEPLPMPAAAPPRPKAAPAQPSQPSPTAPTAPAAASPVDPMVDLFAGQMPDFMVDAHARVLSKKWLGVEHQKELYKFGQEHKDDARPQLLLAYDSMNREWDGIAVRMYRIAYRADKRAKEDPRMLNDLITVASRFEKVEHREAVGILQEAYGKSALPRIDEELAALRSRGEMMRVTRLERARAELAK